MAGASIYEDLAGHLRTLTYPSGEGINYGYDDLWRQTGFSSSLGGVAVPGSDYNAMDQPVY